MPVEKRAIKKSERRTGSKVNLDYESNIHYAEGREYFRAMFERLAQQERAKGTPNPKYLAQLETLAAHAKMKRDMHFSYAEQDLEHEKSETTKRKIRKLPYPV